MLTEWHTFEYRASVPWPAQSQRQVDWVSGVRTVEDWLNLCVGPQWAQWAWDQGHHHYQLGVAFRWDQDRLLFVMTWA